MQRQEGTTLGTQGGTRQSSIELSSFEHLGIASTTARTAADYASEYARIERLDSFARLSSLYQFAINYKDESLQNRQSHSIMVAETARELAQQLGLSDASAALAASIGLAHDLGHPPFSHWGESALNDKFHSLGATWHHDLAGILTVTRWASESGEEKNLELSPETLEGVAKRFWRFDPNAPLSYTNHSRDHLPKELLNRDAECAGVMELSYFNHLEGQIAGQADRISFNASDIQDGLRIGRLTPEMLANHFPAAFETYERLLQEFIFEFKAQYKTDTSDTRLKELITSTPELHGVIFEGFSDAFRSYQMSDLVNTTRERLARGSAEGSLRCAQDIRKVGYLVAENSTELKAQFRTFQIFCRDVIFKKHTAPFKPIMESVIHSFSSGEAKMPLAYHTRWKSAESESEKMGVIAEYLTREMSDRDALIHAQRYAPTVYAEHFPGYERVPYSSISKDEAFHRLHLSLNPADEKIPFVGMPTIHASELDFREGVSIPVVSSTRKYILPIPKKGETIQVPYHGKKRSGEDFQIGQPITDWKGNPISGKGVVFFNADDDQWVAAISGLEGDAEKVFIVNEPNDVQAALLDAQRATWADPDSPTKDEFYSILTFAGQIHLLEGITESDATRLRNYIEDRIITYPETNSSTVNTSAVDLVNFCIHCGILRTSSDDQLKHLTTTLAQLQNSASKMSVEGVIEALNASHGGLKNIYPSDVKYVKKSLIDVETNPTSPSSLYGFKMRNRNEEFRAIYIDHAFELAGWAGNSERSFTGAVVIQRNGKGCGIVQNFRAIQSYEHPDGRRLLIEDIPVQKVSMRSRYQTKHTVQREVTTAVTIIGAGVSGLASAVHLIKNFPAHSLVSHKLALTFIDSASEPGGSTYNRPDANIVGMANGINVLGIESATGIVEFLNQNPQLWIERFPSLADAYDHEIKSFHPQTIITHNQYGTILKEYFLSIVQGLERDGFPVEINIIQDRVMSSEGKSVTLKSGHTITSDAVIYCIGNAMPRAFRRADDPSKLLDGTDGYYRLDDQAWSLGNINESSSTIVLGTANGALFGALWAVGNGYTGNFKLISSSGTVPEIAGISRPYVRSVLTLEKLTEYRNSGTPITAQLLKRLFYRELVSAQRMGHSWRDVVDATVPDANAIWQLLSDEEQRIFHSTYGPKWNNARYRIPDAHWEQIQELREAGRIEILGNLMGISPCAEGGFEVLIRNDDGSLRKEFASKIVNNTGPSKNYDEMPECIKHLISSEITTLHHISGISVDEFFRLKGKDGTVSTGIYAVGPIVSGAHPESVTVPAIRGNVTVMSKMLIDEVVWQKEREYLLRLKLLENQFTPPSSDEVRTFVRDFITRGESDDPRDPNSSLLITTQQIYGRGRDAQGDVIYSAERTALHNEIITKALSGKRAVAENERPAFISVAGGMSVGMTYLQRLLMNEGVLDLERTVIITPLNFLPIPEFAVRSHYQHTEKSPLMVAEYYDIVRKIIAQAVASNMNVVWVDQADASEPLTQMVKEVRSKGYESAMLALTMTPEAYYAASELWLHKFNRIPDHRRGFGDLQEFSALWDGYCSLFDTTALYETFFHVRDIDKDESDPTRREYTVREIARCSQRENGKKELSISLPQRYQDFRERALFLHPNSTTPAEARRNYPYRDVLQLPSEVHSHKASENISQNLSTDTPCSLATKLQKFQDADFEAKFLALVRKTSENRARRAREQTGQVGSDVAAQVSPSTQS